MFSFKFQIYFLISLTSRLSDFKVYANPCFNGDWIQYKDEKCFFLVKKPTNSDESHSICKQLSQEKESEVTLAVIQSEEEQKFINNILYEKMKVVDAVWIGVHRKDKNTFVTDNGHPLEFNNWQNGSPTNLETRNCVELKSEFTLFYETKKDNIGKWADVPCSKNNLILCQTMQGWSSKMVQNFLLEYKRDLDRTKLTLQNTLNNPVPVGFIYSQLPGQAEPSKIWPNLKWSDVSAEYAGLFFRILGGGSGQFDAIQEENSPRLTEVRTLFHRYNQEVHIGVQANNDWSADVHTGNAFGNAPMFLGFKVSSGEVRPRNKAIKVWKRIQ